MEKPSGLVVSQMEACGLALQGKLRSDSSALWWMRRQRNDDCVKNKQHLLGLPAEIRNQIFRLAVVKEGHVAVGANADPQPGLLSVCHRIRSETAPIYYCENRFLVRVLHYCIELAKNWFSLYNRYGNLHGASIGYSIMMAGQPNWANLFDWCKSIHSGVMVDFPMVNNPNSVEHTTVSSMQATVLRMQGRPWNEVAAVLETFRNVLTALQPQWAT